MLKKNNSSGRELRARKALCVVSNQLHKETNLVFKKRHKNFGVVIRKIKDDYKNINNVMAQQRKQLKQAKTHKQDLQHRAKIKTTLKKKQTLDVKTNAQTRVLKKDIITLKTLIRLQVITQVQLKAYEQLLKQITSLIKTTPKIIPKPKPKIISKPKGGPKPKPKIMPKPKPKPKILRKPKLPRKPGVPPKEPKIPKMPRLNFDTKLPKGTILKFNALYKVKGKIQVLRLGLPLHKAMKRVGQLIDRTTSRSMELKISGTTKQKDISKPSVIKKFRTRKSKNNKVLDLVEKSKHAIDSRGEKKGLTIQKALKPKKKHKKTKKVMKKSIKKGKKSSQKRSKTLKHSKR